MNRILLKFFKTHRHKGLLSNSDAKNNLKITRYAIACAHCRHALTCYYHADDVINAAEADDVINSSFIHAYEQSTLLLSNLVVSKLKKKEKIHNRPLAIF